MVSFDRTIPNLQRLVRRNRVKGAAFETAAPEDALAYRKRLSGQIMAEHERCEEALRLIWEEISALPDPADREHAPFHEVRYLMTFAVTPPGPGTLVDIDSSAVYAAPLRRLKGWTIAAVPTLAIDYETDSLPFADESVDCVLLCEVLEHFVLDPMHCLIEVNRILRPGGHFVVTTPNAASWYAVHQTLQQKHPSRWPHYVWNAEYLVWEVELLLTAAGFTDIVSTTMDYGVAPPYPIIPGHSRENRGETIFSRAVKSGRPNKRAVWPIYLREAGFQ